MDMKRREFGRKSDGGQGDGEGGIKALQIALKKRDDDLRTWVEKANAEMANNGKIATETKAALDVISKAGEEMQARLLDLEQKLARDGGGGSGPAVKSCGELLTECESFVALAQKGRGLARVSIKATDITSNPDTAGALIQPERVPGIVAPPQRQMTIRDLLMPGRTGSNAVEYVQEVGFTNAAGPVAEGALKPQSDLVFELKTTAVKTIAHWFRASRQVLSDIPLLESYINGRAIYGLKYAEEEQLLAGDGTGQNILGLLPQATAFDEGRLEAGDTLIDRLRKAVTQVRLAEYRATGIVLHPADWEHVELQKDATGAYIWVNVQDGGAQRMWRLPVVDTTAITKGEFLVGAFRQAAQVFDREDAAVEVATQDGDNFVRNMVTILAEERLALAVTRPEAFVTGSIG